MTLARTLALLALTALLQAQTVSPPTITTASLPYGTVGNSYAAQLTSSNGATTSTWSIISGSLPNGLLLDPNKGVISGTVTAAGTYPFTVKLVNPTTGQSATKNLFIGIPQITNAAVLPNAGTGTQYSVTFTASDGPAPYTWSIDVAPAGLALDQKQGTLTGSPTKAGNYSFTITASGSADKSSAAKAFTLAVLSTPTIATPSPLPNADAASPYKAPLSASGGAPPYRWTVVGSLPAGLSLDPSTGVIGGTPAAAGAYNFTVQVSDSGGGTATKAFALTINPPLAITTPSPLPTGTAGVSYSSNIAASGGMAPYTFTVGATTPFGQSALPAGVVLNPNGLLGGNPTAAGTYNFSIVVTDAVGAQTNSVFALTITGPLAIATPSPLAAGTTGVPYSQNIIATGGVPQYTFALRGTPPPGLTLSPAGLVAGTPTANGTFNFTVVVTDSSQNTVSNPFQITIANIASPLTVSPASLSFSAPVGGDSPGLESLMVFATAGPTRFTVQVVGVTANSAPPPWLEVTPIRGTTPERLVVSVDPSSMSAGDYTARIRIVPLNTSVAPVDIPVTFTLIVTAPKLVIIPDYVRLTARADAPVTLEHALVLRNGGGGSPINFTASIAGQSAWIRDITPASGQTAQNAPVYLAVHVNTAGLKVGAYRDVIHITSSAGNVDIPVSLFVAGSGPILGLHVTGARFRIKQGNSTLQPQTVNVLHLGDTGSAIHWTAELLSGAGWLSISPASGTSRVGDPGILTLVPSANAATLPVGAYYAMVRVADPLALNSPHYLTAVLEVADTQAIPVLETSPAQLLFTAPAGPSAPAAQVIRLYTSNPDPVPYQISEDTRDGVNWLTAVPSAGQASTQSPGQITVTANPAGLAPGTHMGHISVGYGTSIRVVNVNLIVTPAGSTSAPVSTIQAAPGCTPARLAITETGLPDSFAVPAKWPANLIVQVNDDCAAPVLGGSVIASFSNGDAPLTLRGDLQTGSYSATWQPGSVTSQMTVTIRAAAASLQPATAQLLGGISPNRAPVLAKNGTVNALNRVAGAAVAPAMIVEVYGSDLASLTTTPDKLPLPTTANGTFLIVGPIQTPLYFLSNGQVDAEIPAELAPNKQYTMVISANGALTLPEPIEIVPVQPGIAASTDGHVIAQHGADFSLVDAAHPAKPGEFLIIYLSGMGATNPSVGSGSPAPGVEPLARLTPPPGVKINGQDAEIVFAGLTPGLVGLYQINLRVPANVSPGDLDLVVKQGEVMSNTTKLPVGQ